MHTTASLGYRIEDGEPFSLHVISITADVTDAVSQDSKNKETLLSLKENESGLSSIVGVALFMIKSSYGAI
ncbi:MAG: hypothetical protein GX461_09145 [Clostridiales bacterium]|nr:hypothetical protein [Clostridiales bacterium]